MATQATVSKPLLRNVPLFATLSEEQLDALCGVARRKSYARGEPVMLAGEINDSLFVVIAGRLKVVLGDKTGREVILSVLGPREYFGEMVLIDEAPGSASVVAVVACELLVISKHNFRKCLAGNIDMAMTVMLCLADRLRKADRKIGSLALMDVYGRVAAQLLEMAEPVDGQLVVTSRVTKQDLAKMVGASREMVSRVWKELEAGGVIEVRGGAIYLRDRVPAIH